MVFLRDGELVGLHFDTVDLVSVELHPIGNLTQLTIDTDGEEALLAKLLKELFVVPFSLLDDWS